MGEIEGMRNIGNISVLIQFKQGFFMSILILHESKKFPYINILSDYKTKNTYFESILVTINDELVNLFLNKKISFITMQKLLIKFINKSVFKKYYSKQPKNIHDINLMVNKVKKLLIKNDKIFQ